MKYHPLTEKLWDSIRYRDYDRKEADKTIRQWLEEKANYIYSDVENTKYTFDEVMEILELNQEKSLEEKFRESRIYLKEDTISEFAKIAEEHFKEK